MSLLALNDYLRDANFHYRHVYSHEGKPTLYSAESANKSLVVAYRCERDKFKEEWCVMGVSEDRLEKMEKGLIDLQTAFLQTESDAVVFLSYDNANGRLDQVRVVFRHALRKEEIPVPGTTLMGTPTKLTAEQS